VSPVTSLTGAARTLATDSSRHAVPRTRSIATSVQGEAIPRNARRLFPKTGYFVELPRKMGLPTLSSPRMAWSRLPDSPAEFPWPSDGGESRHSRRSVFGGLSQGGFQPF
jgi:hypothetical protein